MYFWSPALSASIAAQHGVVGVDQLLADGATHHSLRRAVRDGLLVAAHRGVYRVATSPDTLRARCVAACLADREAFVTGPTAAELWGFRHVPTSALPVVAVAHGRHPFAGGVVVRRTKALDADDLVMRDDGIRLAAPPRAWFECARDLHDRRFEMLTEWVLDHHCSVPTLWSVCRRLAVSGRPGSARVRRVMSQRSDWQRPAGSGLELRVLRALERRGVPELTRQHPIKLPSGVVVHPDGADVIHRWAVEVDHVTWHGGRLEAQADKTRDRQLRRIDWQVDRVTDQELRDDFAGTIAELAELHRLRASQRIGLAS